MLPARLGTGGCRAAAKLLKQNYNGGEFVEAYALNAERHRVERCSEVALADAEGGWNARPVGMGDKPATEAAWSDHAAAISEVLSAACHVIAQMLLGARSFASYAGI